MPSKQEVRDKILGIVKNRKLAVKQIEKELDKLFDDYFRRVKAMALDEMSQSEALSLTATTRMMQDLEQHLRDAGLDDVLDKYSAKFRPLAREALDYFSAFGIDVSLAGVSREAIGAYLSFAESELAKSIDRKLVAPIQSALLQANYGSLTRDEVIAQIQTLDETLTLNESVVLVDDAFSQFQRAMIVQAGENAELEIYQYLGPDDDITSDQCQAMLRYDEHGAEGFAYKDEITVDMHENLRANPLTAGGHPRCFLPGTKVFGKFFRASKSFYSGEAITIHTRKGHTLSVTSNHPILTARGFVPAKLLNPGDQVVSYDCNVEASVPAALTEQFYEYDCPARIEDIFEAISAKGFLSTVRPTPLDLHGDAQPWNGDVDIVEMNRILPLNNEAVSLQGGSKNVLGGVNVGRLSPLTDSLVNLFVDRDNTAPTRFPSGSQLAFHQDRIALNALPFHHLTFGAGAFFDSIFTQYALNSSLSDAMLAFQLHNRFPAEILLDEIVDVRRAPFRGHVYDLESATGWLIADGVCTSNCRHAWTPVTLEYAMQQGFQPR